MPAFGAFYGHQGELDQREIAVLVDETLRWQRPAMAAARAGRQSSLAMRGVPGADEPRLSVRIFPYVRPLVELSGWRRGDDLAERGPETFIVSPPHSLQVGLGRTVDRLAAPSASAARRPGYRLQRG